MPGQFPKELEAEFETIRLIADSTAVTRGVDSLLLAWIKYEKQSRKLFTYLIYQHPAVHASDIADIVEALVNNRKLYPETFLGQIEALSGMPLPKIIGAQFGTLEVEVARIKKYRNKLAHGQSSGLNLTTVQLLADVDRLAAWMSALGKGAQAVIGYDGIGRDSFVHAKSTTTRLQTFPFQTIPELVAWIGSLG
jgi:hypothetical protein